MSRGGKLRMPRPPRGWAIQRKLAYYSSPNECGCVIWKSSLRPDGYGEIYHEGRLWRAHRLAWTLTNGDIPSGYHVCHSCDVPACINPDHLFLGTDADNMRDKVRKGRQPRGEVVGLITRGEKNGCAKITEADAIAIKAATGLQREIGARYGITQSAVSLIKLGKNWSHLRSLP